MILRAIVRRISSHAYRFSKLEEQISMAKGKLRNQVMSEYKHEYQNYEPQELSSVIEELGFAVQDDKDSSKIELVRTFRRAKINILFQATRPLLNSDDVEKNEGNEYQDEEPDAVQKQIQEKEETQETVAKFSVDFTVYIQAQSGETISYECNSADQKININYITFIYDLEHHQKLSKVERLINIYNGPIFNTLDESLQSGLRDYLQSFGVDASLAPIIETLALDKEQRLYMQFLKKMDKFLQ